MSRGLGDLHYISPTSRFSRLCELASLPEFEFDLMCSVEARKFGVRSEALQRLVQHVRGLTPEERNAQFASLDKIES